MSELSQYIILNKKSYFSIAEEFIQLEQLFKCETTFENLNFWIDMILYPLYMIISILGYKQQLGFLSIMSIHKTVTKWQQYFRYLELRNETSKWKKLVQSEGGPFISTNDEKYHTYVYADGMQRLSNTLFSGRHSFLLSKKGSKRL